MKKNIRVALIGTGMISHRHMKVWSHIPEVQVVAAAEIDAAALKRWGEQYHFEEKDLYTDFREMLKRDDIKETLINSAILVQADVYILYNRSIKDTGDALHESTII